jgi:ABC-type oligopeptide transport system substrate-binding subunit
MKKVITLTVALTGALALLSGCQKDKEPRKKEKQTKVVRSEKRSDTNNPKELIELA